MNKDELAKAMELKNKFEKEFRPEWGTGSKKQNKYGITAIGLGGNYYDCKTGESLPVIRVLVLSKIRERRLTAELRSRDDSRDFLHWEGAAIEIEVSGRFIVCKRTTT